jgi:hypothetical protein
MKYIVRVINDNNNDMKNIKFEIIKILSLKLIIFY